MYSERVSYDIVSCLIAATAAAAAASTRSLCAAEILRIARRQECVNGLLRCRHGDILKRGEHIRVLLLVTGVHLLINFQNLHQSPAWGWTT